MLPDDHQEKKNYQSDVYMQETPLNLLSHFLKQFLDMKKKSIK